MLVDTHCHIHDEDYPLDQSEALARAAASGVKKVIVIGTTTVDSARAKAFAESHENVFWTFGYHPSEYHGDLKLLKRELDGAKELIKSPKLVAIGEVGLEYHFSPYDRQAQIQLLETMLQLACDHHLPVSFHVRDAFDDFWPIIENFKLRPSVLHSFSDSQAVMERGIRAGFYFGMNGLATFADLPHPPIERIVLETDAPFLTPKPFRGKINTPERIVAIANWVAAHYGLSPSEVARITTKNAQQIFNI